MVIDHACGLHEGTADGGADEVEAAFFQVFAHRIGLRGARRNFPSQATGVYQRLASDKPPDVTIERAELVLHRQKRLGVPYCRRDLQPVADDSLIAQQPFGLAAVIAGDLLCIEPIKGGAIIFALLQNGVPAQAGLRPFQNKELKQDTVVMLRDAPLAIVIKDR